MENKKNLAIKNKDSKNIDMKKEYDEYKKFLINERIKNSPKFLETNAEKNGRENRIPLLKRQYGFNESKPYYV